MAGRHAVKKPNGQAIGEPFAPILDRLIENHMYQQLPPLACKILVHMIYLAPRPYRGEVIVLGSRKAAEHCRVHHTTAWRAMREIDQSGLATIADLGRTIRHRYGDTNRATRWRLDFWENPE